MYRKNLFIFIIFLAGFVLNVISVQIVSSSFKDLQGALGASVEQISYVMSASLIAEVIIIPFSGWLARLLSTRVLFLISIIMQLELYYKNTHTHTRRLVENISQLYNIVMYEKA